MSVYAYELNPTWRHVDKDLPTAILYQRDPNSDRAPAWSLIMSLYSCNIFFSHNKT